MKMRKHRKRKQELFRRHRTFMWSVIECITTISEAQLKMSAALEAAYAEVRTQRQEQE